MDSKRYLPPLTGIRAIAAGLVFFYHWFFSYAAALPLLVRAPFEVGYVGVPIFFALSGFLLTVRYHGDFQHQRITFGAYLKKRFIRIYPLYFVVLTFFVIALQRPEQMVPKDARSLIATYTLTQALFPDLVLLGITVAWTLTIEGMFYFLAPGLMKWLAHGRTWLDVLLRAVIPGLISIGLGLLVARLPLAESLPNTLAGAPDAYLMHYSIFGNLPAFLAGMVCGLFFLRRDALPLLERHASALIWLGIAGAFAAIVALDVTGGEPGSPFNHALDLSVACFASSLILGMACDYVCSRSNLVTRALGSPVMVYLGVISYSLFLVQLTEPCQWLYWILLGRMGVENRIARAILLYVIVTALAAVLYKLIERPAQRWLHARLVKI